MSKESELGKKGEDLAVEMLKKKGYQIKARRAVGSEKIVPKESELAASSVRSVPRFENSALFAEWRALHERYGTNSAAMPVLYKVVGGLTDPFRRHAFEAALVAEWVEVDPARG